MSNKFCWTSLYLTTIITATIITTGLYHINSLKRTQVNDTELLKKKEVAINSEDQPEAREPLLIDSISSEKENDVEILRNIAFEKLSELIREKRSNKKPTNKAKNNSKNKNLPKKKKPKNKTIGRKHHKNHKTTKSLPKRKQKVKGKKKPTQKREYTRHMKDQYSTKTSTDTIPYKTFFQNLTANDEGLEDCRFHILNGDFLLKFDGTSSKFYDKNSKLVNEDEKCPLESWGEENMNILFMDIELMDRLRYSHPENNTESISRITDKNEKILYAPEAREPLLKHSNAGNFTNKTAFEAQKEETLKIFRPLLQNEELKDIWNSEINKMTKIPGENIQRKKNKEETFERYYREADIEKNLPESNGQRPQQSTGMYPSINLRKALKSFSSLIDFVNKYLLKTYGSHMVLLPKKLYAVLSGKTNMEDFLFKLIEKSRNIQRQNRDFLLDCVLFQINIFHFSSADPSILKNSPSDILQLKFKISSEIESIASKKSNKHHFIRQVSENCLSVPIKREPSIQIEFSVKQLSKNILVRSPFKINHILLNSVSKETAANFRGEFVLQIKKACRAEELLSRSANYSLKMDSILNNQTDLLLETTSQAHTAHTQEPATDENEDISDNPPSSDFDHWIYNVFLQAQNVVWREEFYRPEDFFKILLSLFEGISMPPHMLYPNYTKVDSTKNSTKKEGLFKLKTEENESELNHCFIDLQHNSKELVTLFRFKTP